MQIVNRCDIPSRYLRPYTDWLFANLPKVGPSLKARTSTRWTAAGLQTTQKESTIEAVAYYLAPADEPCGFTYREPKDPRKAGDHTKPNHLNIFIPRCSAQSQTNKAQYLAKLKVRLYEVTVTMGQALWFFGREPLPDGPMPLHRQRIGKLWMEQGDTLLNSWRKFKSHENIKKEIHRQTVPQK